MPVRNALIGALAALLVGCDDPVAPEPLDEEEAVDAEALFGLACGSCHGADGRGTTDGPDLVFRVGDLSVEEVADVVQNGAGVMEPVPLPDEETVVVATWVVEQLGAP